MNNTRNRHGVTRRGLLKGATAMGAAGLILPASYRAARAEPQQGGTFRIGLGHGNSTDSYDPGLIDNLYSQVFAAARHNQLIEVDADGQLIPEIAESWESDDGQTWVFRIRQGVTFHSGKDVTVEDVLASLNHHRGEDATSAIKQFFDPVTDISIDGQNIVVTLEAPNGDFAYLMSDYHIAIMPSIDGRIDPTSSDGCGPYVVESFEPGVEATLNRFPDYWKPDRGHFDRVEILAILDSAARLNALMTGQVDLIDQIDPATISMLEAQGAANILSIPGNAHYVFPMDSREAPFNDNNVRLALKYAIDRQQMVDTILGGHGAVSNDNPIGPANRYFYADMEAKTFDPDRARHYLRKADMESLTVNLHVADAAFAGAVDAGALYAETAAQSGITINLVREPNDGYWDNVWMQKPFVASYWGGRAVEDHMFTTGYAAGAAWNDSFWEHDRFNELLVKARSEVDEDLRREMYQEMQRIVSFEGAVVIPMYNNYVMATATNVATPDQVSANWNLDGFRCVERWWFA